MPTTITRIDPALPLCWEDEYTLRFGFDRAELRVTRPTATTQRLIGALRDGVRSDRLAPTLRRLGATQHDWVETTKLLAPILLRELLRPPPLRLMPRHPAPHSPALQPPALHPVENGADVRTRADPSAPLAVAVHGPEGAAEIFRRAGLRAGFVIDADDPSLVISIERFIAPLDRPTRTLPWGAPQLLIRFGDRSIGIGPLISQPGDPCPGCISLGEVDTDPALPAIAAQLLGRVPATETAACAEVAATLGVALALHWRAGREGLGRTRYRLAATDGTPLPRIERQTMSAHPACGCALLTADAERRAA